MNQATIPHNHAFDSSRRVSFHPLDDERRTTVPTAEAAYHLNRAEQTLRYWACSERGPIRPIRINGRLHWPTAGIRKLLGVANEN